MDLSCYSPVNLICVNSSAAYCAVVPELLLVRIHQGFDVNVRIVGLNRNLDVIQFRRLLGPGGKHLSGVYPYLDADPSHDGVRLAESVVNIGT